MRALEQKKECVIARTFYRITTAAERGKNSHMEMKIVFLEMWMAISKLSLSFFAHLD